MKKILTLLIVATLSFSTVYAATNYAKLAKKLDPKNAVAKLDKNCPQCYWEAVRANSKDYMKYARANKNKKNDAVYANDCINTSIETSQPYFSSLKIYDNIDMRDVRALLAGDNTLFNNTSISMINENSANAFCTPDGRIFVTDNLYAQLKSLDPDNIDYHIIGICAHEMTHYVLQHSRVEIYNLQKRANRARIWSTITGVALSAAETYFALKGDSRNYNKVMISDFVTSIVFDAAQINTYGYYRYSYSRNQEYEADVCAYRFMDWIGAGGEKYIKTLQLLNQISPDNSTKSKRTDDHPTNIDRINLLKYIYLKDHNL